MTTKSSYTSLDWPTSFFAAVFDATRSFRIGMERITLCALGFFDNSSCCGTSRIGSYEIPSRFFPLNVSSIVYPISNRPSKSKRSFARISIPCSVFTFTYSASLLTAIPTFATSVQGVVVNTNRCSSFPFTLNFTKIAGSLNIVYESVTSYPANAVSQCEHQKTGFFPS